MTSKPVRIGPFVGGLNNISTAGESKDEEVVELVNFELALDTSLISRPPLTVLKASRSTRKWQILGVYRVTAAEWYTIVQEPVGTEYKVRAYLSGDFSGAAVEIKTLAFSNEVTGYVQYNNFGYFLLGPGSTVNSFRWNKTVVTDVASMPKGTVLVSWKDRLWVTGSGTAVNGNYVWFSTVDSTGPKPDTWNTSTDFFNVDPGSGGLNTAILPLTSTILIFKEDAAYRFGFPLSPKDGEVVNLSRQIGAAGPNSVVGFENYCFVYDQGRVYELMNTRFTQINLGVDLSKNAGINVDAVATGVDISIVGRRLVIRYFTSVYVYSIDTRTWTQWQSHTGTPGRFIEMPGDSSSASPVIYIAPSRGTTQLAGDNRIEDSGFIDDELNMKRTMVEGTGSAVFANGSVTITSKDAPTYVNLTSNGQNNPDIAVSSQQVYSFSIGVLPFTDAKLKVKFNFTKLNGTQQTIEVESTTSAIPTVTVPDGSYLLAVQFGMQGTIAGVDKSLTFDNPILILDPSSSSPVSVIKFTDGYLNTTPLEYIEAYVRTKAFDYQAAAVFKRLFLWGVDVVTPRSLELKAIPLGKKASVTWDMASEYTWNQLAQGTWSSPLSWKGVSKTITDTTDAFTDVSENGRFFVKVPKSLRFRQIQFYVKLTTLGNTESGPAKLFTLTTYTKAGQMVVDKAT